MKISVMSKHERDTNMYGLTVKGDKIKFEVDSEDPYTED